MKKYCLSSVLPYGLLLIPVIMGSMISLFSRDLFSRRYFSSPLLGQYKVSDLIWGFTCAGFPLGGCIGTFLATYLASKLGRKFTHVLMLSIGLLSMLSTILSYVLKSYTLFVIGRFGQGLSSGGLMNTGLVFLFELIPLKSHKICLITIQPLINLGIVISGFFSLDFITKTNWIITSIPVVTLLILCLLSTISLPESPVYVYDKYNEADKIIEIYKKLRFGNTSRAQKEYESLCEKSKHDCKKSLAVSDLMRDDHMYGPLIVSTLIAVFQQLSGINIVIFYISEFIVAAHFPYIDLGTLLAFVVCFLGSVIFSFIIPRMGAKSLMVMGFAGMSGSFAIAYIMYYIKNIPFITLILLSLFLFWFQCGPGPKPWTIFKETFPPEYQSSAQGFLTLNNWITNFLMTAFFPFALTAIGFHSVILFAAVNFVFAVTLAILMVETKNRNYTEILQEYQRKFKRHN